MKALLIKMSSLGDVVHALPAVHDAYQQGWRFDWVVEEGFAAIPGAAQTVEKVIPIAWRRWRRQPLRYRHEMAAFRRLLVEQNYELVLDSQGLIKSALVAYMSRGLLRAGFNWASAREGLASLVSHRRAPIPGGQHAIDRQRQLFAASFGYAVNLAEAPDFGLGNTRSNGGLPRCTLLHGTTWASKHYPESLWVELAHHAADAGMDVSVIWGSDEERARAERIAQNSDAEVQPRLALDELIDHLARSQVVIGVDSGLTHLAAALDVPTIGIYGSTDARLTGCRGRVARALSVDFECAPCLRRNCQFASTEGASHLLHPPCYATLNSELVWRQAMELLRADRVLPV